MNICGQMRRIGGISPILRHCWAIVIYSMCRFCALHFLLEHIFWLCNVFSVLCNTCTVTKSPKSKAQWKKLLCLWFVSGSYITYLLYVICITKTENCYSQFLIKHLQYLLYLQLQYIYHTQLWHLLWEVNRHMNTVSRYLAWIVIL